jgi:hypothetical protein
MVLDVPAGHRNPFIIMTNPAAASITKKSLDRYQIYAHQKLLFNASEHQMDDITLRSPNSVCISPSVFFLPDSRTQPPETTAIGAENNTQLGSWPRTSIDMQDKIS